MRSVSAGSQLGGARSSQPLDKPERPDHEKGKEENSSTRKERRCKTCGHDILPEVLIACSLDSSLTQRWCPAATMSRVIRSSRPAFAPSFAEQLRRSGNHQQAFVSKISGDQVVRTSASANVNPSSGGTYQISVGVERVQKARLIGASIWLNSLQRVFIYEK
jgi:hypothetical protein